MLKLISIVTPCYNESENVEALYNQVSNVMSEFPKYDFEHIFIDNCSTDGTDLILKRMALNDKRVKVIFNSRNFGHIRSPYHAFFQSKGDAVITLCADFQDPTYLIVDFIKKWESGYKIVMGIKAHSKENWLEFRLRRLYYRVLKKMSGVPLVENFVGYGLFDRQVVEILRKYNDPYPYFRGLVAEVGFESAKIEYESPKRKNGVTKNNFYSLFDVAMLGLTNNTKVPLRMATILGVCISVISFIVGVVYFIMKLIHWNNFEVGLAPLVVGLSFLGGIQILFLGLIGEYIGAIYTQVLHRPLVVERERINFD